MICLITLKELSFLIKVSFAVTINKVQGQTFKHVGIDLWQDCFTHGQLYVALGCGENQHVLQLQENKTIKILCTQKYLRISPNKNTANYINTYIILLQIRFSTEKYEPGPGFEPRISRSLDWCF